MRQGSFSDILPQMKPYLFFMLILFVSVIQAAEEMVAELGAEFWFTPRHGDVLVAHEVVRAAVKKLIAEPEAYLLLRHPETESGELWGQELQAWLISLGLVADRMELQPAPEQLESVTLIVVSPDVEADQMSLIEDIDAEVKETDMMAGSDEQSASSPHMADEQRAVEDTVVDVQVETESE